MEEAADWPPELLVRRRMYELDLSPEQIGSNLLAELARLEPHGEANRRPKLRLGPLERNGPVREFGNGHISLRARSPRGAARPSGRSVWLLGWSWKERIPDLDGRFEVLGALEWDSWRGGPVVNLEDARPAEAGEAAPRRMPA